MLILSRNTAESIVIGDEIKVIVLSVRGEQVRLGIDAPKDVVVIRDEIHRMLEASRDAADNTDKLSTVK